MSDVANNVPGKYYVDADYCLCTGNCVIAAPDHFKLVTGKAIVIRQPVTAEEDALCQKAWYNCPVRAVCDDGDLVDE